MDRSPEDDTRIARQAIARLEPPVELRRLRLRRAGGEHFADVVIGVAPGAAIGQGHAAADRVEQALHDALPGIDVVVHVEPGRATAAIRERVLAAALTVSHVREIHNLTVLDVDGSIEVSLHLKLPGDLSLDQAHEIAEQVEAAIVSQVPEVESVADAPRAASRDGCRQRRSTSTRRRSRPPSERRPAPSRASSASCAPTTASSSSSRSALGRRRLARRRARPGERDRGARARCRPGDRRRRGAHGAVKLCMFHPVGHPLERGWVGRVDGDRVVQLAAQTLQSFFTGGGSAREHAEYPLDEVRAPRAGAPPAVDPRLRRSVVVRLRQSGCGRRARRFDPAPSDTAARGALAVLPRVAAVVGADGAIGGFTMLAEWRAPALEPPKDRDFALGLGPVVVTADEFSRTDVGGSTGTAAAALSLRRRDDALPRRHPRRARRSSRVDGIVPGATRRARDRRDRHARAARGRLTCGSSSTGTEP